MSGVDTGRVFKQPVYCPSCHENYLFTLRAIAEQSALICPSCGFHIATSEQRYQHIVTSARATLRDIGSRTTR